MTTASDVQRAWQESAPYWEKHRASIERMFAPLTSALMQEARMASGQRVLDVAGGTGEPSLTIANALGPAGSVMYTDLVAPMVESARAEARRRQLTNIDFCQSAADSLPFPNDSFDAAVSRLGAMFFTDPVAGVHEMLRVIRPGGHISFVVWAEGKVNPFFHVVTDVMDRYVESPPEDADAPGAFRFAAPGKLAAILEQAGASQIKQRDVRFRIEAPVRVEQFWPLRVDMSETLRAKAAKLGPATLSVVKREVENAALRYSAAGRLSFPAQALLVSAKKAALFQA